MFFVIDTNVLISAALGEGSCRTAFELACQRGQLAKTDETLRELALTFEKPRLQKFLQDVDKIEFISNFMRLAKTIEVTERITICRDNKDNMFLELSLACKAHALVTRDGDLLALHPFREIPVLTVSNFIKRFTV